MKKVITIIILLSVLSIGAKSQTPISIFSIDAETYALWAKKDWKELISVGKAALKNDIDFYYLRVRMGIAYYERKNYHMAIHHFEKAIELNPQESYLSEYLYYSYLFSGREHDARLIALTFPIPLAQKIGTLKENFIDQLNIHYGINRIQEYSSIENFSINVDPLLDGSQEITKKLNIISIGLKHNFSPKFSLHHTYTNIQKTAFLFKRENGSSKYDQLYKTQINQYYISASTWLGKGSTLLLGAHIINVRSPVEVKFFRQGIQYTYTETANENSYLGFLSYYKNLKYITLGASIYGSNLNYANQFQGDLSITLNPLGNLNLYSTSILSYQKEVFLNKKQNDAIVLNQLIGFKVFKGLWLEGFVAYGNTKNFIANNGLTVFNSTETIKERFGARGIVVLSSKVNLQITYTYSKLESSFISENDKSITYNPITFNNQTILGGLIWNF
jgi:tetratricopeptide (TPR) repeat protein